MTARLTQIQLGGGKVYVRQAQLRQDLEHYLSVSSGMSGRGGAMHSGKKHRSCMASKGLFRAMAIHTMSAGRHSLYHGDCLAVGGADLRGLKALVRNLPYLRNLTLYNKSKSAKVEPENSQNLVHSILSGSSLASIVN